MDAAPFHRDAAGGPPARAVWVAASDGARLRLAAWPRDGARGTVVMFPGRTEFVEKYARPAEDLAARGFAAAAIDWRGQGLTERGGRDRMVGHVDDFADYQRDADAMLAALGTLGLPRPWHLLAHSMGGLIGLRALLRGLPFERAVFSAPMWGLPLVPHKRVVATLLSRLATRLGRGGGAVPASGKVADPAGAPFEGNLLTRDREAFEWMRAILVAHPDLALGTPSMSWLNAALDEMAAVRALASPSTPALILVGTDEGIVDRAAIDDRLARWPGARLEPVEGARHEVLMEDRAVREALHDVIARHLG